MFWIKLPFQHSNLAKGTPIQWFLLQYVLLFNFVCWKLMLSPTTIDIREMPRWRAHQTNSCMPLFSISCSSCSHTRWLTFFHLPLCCSWKVLKSGFRHIWTQSVSYSHGLIFVQPQLSSLITYDTVSSRLGSLNSKQLGGGWMKCFWLCINCSQTSPVQNNLLSHVWNMVR